MPFCTGWGGDPEVHLSLISNSDNSCILSSDTHGAFNLSISRDQPVAADFPSAGREISAISASQSEVGSHPSTFPFEKIVSIFISCYLLS